jgi:hypothetical protein
MNVETPLVTTYKKQILITIRKYQNDHIRLAVMKVDIHRAYEMSTKDNLFKINMISISMETVTISKLHRKDKLTCLN